MQYYPFDSRNILYRDKIGALAEGETLRLKALLHFDAHVHNVYLCIKEDGEQNYKEIELYATDWLASYRFYEGEIKLSEGLYWYHFRYTSDFGEFFVSKSETSLGVVSYSVSDWQQTVYLKDYKTPDWLDGGIIYQIFPDRFYFSGEDKKDIPADRYICLDWEKQPEYRQPKDNICCLGNDYYRGDLLGIEKKLDYLKELGVNCLYLNPIFEAHSNHRYNTADYMKIDPMLGDEKALQSLIKKAEKKGIYIILDGVFSHTGDDSVYFNKYNRYDSIGAYNSSESKYFNWFKFKNYPDDYHSWWGIETLPETVEDNAEFLEFITGEKGIIRYWLKKGIKGWRLDVADELPDVILDNIRNAVKAEGEENYLLGEVWEDASNKISYGTRRRFLRGRQLDSVMNYPFANAIVDYLRDGNAEKLMNTVLQVVENYPPQSVKLLMNHIGTHDTARILTRLGTDRLNLSDRESQAELVLSDEEYKKGTELLKLAAVLQFTFPGIPSIYYGDEAGMQGGSDPFCRGGYPWGRENIEILELYKKLGSIRRGSKAFCSGEFIPVKSDSSVIAFIRKNGENKAFIAVNNGTVSVKIKLPSDMNFINAFGTSPDGGEIELNSGEYTILT